MTSRKNSSLKATRISTGWSGIWSRWKRTPTPRKPWAASFAPSTPLKAAAASSPLPKWRPSPTWAKTSSASCATRSSPSTPRSPAPCWPLWTPSASCSARSRKPASPAKRTSPTWSNLLARLSDGTNSTPEAPPVTAAAPAPAPVQRPAPRPSEAPGSPAPAAGAGPRAAPAAEPSEAHNSAVSDSTIRVDVGLLDKLMNLVGELVLARNQILQFTTQSADADLPRRPSQRLNLITTELQESVMKTRMQPIGNVWSKFPRVVRDLARDLRQAGAARDGRQGDRARQDHHRGDQGPADPHRPQLGRPRHRDGPRRARQRGKPDGRLPALRAFHEGGQVNIEITDDGGGIDLRAGQSRRPCSAALITAGPGRPHERPRGRST